MNFPPIWRRDHTKKMPFKQEKRKKHSIIVMTANVFHDDIKKCIKTDMNDHIGTPTDTKELLSKLNKYLYPNFSNTKMGHV